MGAYYLDFQHKHADYVKRVIDKLINWSLRRRILAQGEGLNAFGTLSRTLRYCQRSSGLS